MAAGQRGGWQRSSYSGAGGEGCVELARTAGGFFLLRESDAPPAAVLRTGARRLAALLAAAKAGRFAPLRPR